MLLRNDYQSLSIIVENITKPTSHPPTPTNITITKQNLPLEHYIINERPQTLIITKSPLVVLKAVHSNSSLCLKLFNVGEMSNNVFDSITTENFIVLNTV
jgi:hypothetical protein